MWIAGGAFLLTIVFAWGMDFSGAQLSGDLGKVNGRKISVQEFQQLYQYNYQTQQQRLGGQSMDEAFIEYIQDQTWQQLVTQILIDEEIDRLGLSATDEEVRYAIRYNPPSEVRQIPDFQTNGVFDAQKYEAAMRNEQLRGFWVQLEQNMRALIPEQKLQHLVSASVTVTDEEARQSYRYRNESLSAEFVLLDPVSYPDTTLTVTDQEIRDYYREHREDYQHPDRVEMNYVLLYKQPSPGDLSGIQQTLTDLRQRLASGEDFATLARQYSDDTTAPQGGDLGWVGPGDMVPPFEEASSSLQIDEISAPVRTDYGWHIIEVDSIRTTGGQEERKVRHILLREEPSAATLDSLRGLLEDLRTNAEQEDFTTAATRLGVEVMQTGPVQSGGFVPGLGYEPDAIRFGLRNRVGVISEVMEHPGGFYLLQVRDKTAEGIEPLDSVRSEIHATIVQERTLEGLRSRARELASQLKQRPHLFTATAEEAGYRVSETGSFTRNDFVSGVGRDAAFIAAAFAVPTGGVSDPVQGESGWYVIHVTEHNEVTGDQMRSLLQSEKRDLLRTRQQEAFNRWLTSLTQKAKIVDNRDAFFG